MRPLHLFNLVVGLCTTLGLASVSRADQLQCNQREDAQRAQSKVVPGAIGIAYCSLCTDRVQVMRITETKIVQDCSYELEVTGELLLHTQSLNEGTFGKRTRFEPTQGTFKQRVDLAYFYVEVARNKFKWLGGVIGLKAQVHTKTIRLPADLYGRLGSKASDLAEQPPATARTKMRQLGLSLFKGGPLGQAVAAFDAGRLGEAQAAADDALSALVKKTIARSGIPGIPAHAALRGLVEAGLRDRLHHPSSPLANLGAGTNLKHLEKLPVRGLEQAMATLAVWAAINAFREETVTELDVAAVSLVTDPRTVHALGRRAPLAAQLARFYGALFHLALGERNHRTADVKIMAARVGEYFDERPGLSGNYGRVLQRLIR